VSALEEFSGSRAGLSASAVGRLTTDWQNERRAFADRDLSSVDHVYLWVDGAHFTVHPGHRRVRADGSKELVVFVDGYRKSLSRGRTCCATAAACRTYEMPFVSHHIGPSASPILVPRKGILTSRRLTIHDRWSGGRRESHPPAPTDPGVNLSAHRALVTLFTRRAAPRESRPSVRTCKGTVR